MRATGVDVSASASVPVTENVFPEPTDPEMTAPFVEVVVLLER